MIVANIFFPAIQAGGLHTAFSVRFLMVDVAGCEDLFGLVRVRARPHFK